MKISPIKLNSEKNIVFIDEKVRIVILVMIKYEHVVNTNVNVSYITIIILEGFNKIFFEALIFTVSISSSNK